MRRWLLIVPFAALVVGSAMFQAHLKAWPQVVTLVIAAATLVAYGMRQLKAFYRGWVLVLGIATLETLLVLGDRLYQMLFPKEGVIVVDGMERRLMSYGWVWSTLGAILLTPLVVWAYRRWVKRVPLLEMLFVAGLFLTWSALFVVHEL